MDLKKFMLEFNNILKHSKTVFTFYPFQGILHSALHNEYWRLIDSQGKPTGVMGWWPSRAVTFLENHDTGSTQVSLSLPPSSPSPLPGQSMTYKILT